MNKETIVFEKLPSTQAVRISTASFAKAFAAMRPNAAITIHQTSSNEQAAATIIVRLSEPVAYPNGNYTELQYTFEQAPLQAGVGSLEAFAKVVGDGTNNGCSLFIDNSSW